MQINELQKTKKYKVILNKVFPNATYMTNYDNIGHEIINLFQEDNGRFFIHLNPNGTYDKKYSDPDVVLNVTRAGTNLYQIISKAVGCQTLAAAQIIGKNKGEERYKNQKDDEIRYGGFPVEEYFKHNLSMQGEEEKDLFATFECEGIYEAKAPIYITFGNAGKRYSSLSDKNICVLNNVEAWSSACRLVEKITEGDQDRLLELAKDDKLWKEEPVPTLVQRYNNFKEKSIVSDEDCFTFLGVEKSELAYSNALVNILKFDTNYVTNFLNELLGKNCKENNFEILREEKNIDILFRDLDKKNGKIVIIENKIDAGITLSDGDKTVKEQMEKKEYYKGEEDISKFFDNYLSMKASQLSKYYIIAVGWAVEAGWSDEKIKEDIYCYFLCPEYHKLIYKTKNDNGCLDIGLACDDKYTLITYGRINEILSEFDQNVLSSHKRFLFKDFVQAISRLAKTRDDSMELKMIRMFIQRYDELKAKGGSKI